MVPLKIPTPTPAPWALRLGRGPGPGPGTRDLPSSSNPVAFGHARGGRIRSLALPLERVVSSWKEKIAVVFGQGPVFEQPVVFGHFPGRIRPLPRSYSATSRSYSATSRISIFLTNPAGFLTGGPISRCSWAWGQPHRPNI